MEMSIHVKKLDMGCILTEDVPHRKGRTRAIENGDRFVDYMLEAIKKHLTSNSMNEFVVKFEINPPPPEQAKS